MELGLFLYVIFIVFLFIIKSVPIFILIGVVFLLIFVLHPKKPFRAGFVAISIVIFTTFIGNVLFKDGRILVSILGFDIAEDGFNDAIINASRIFSLIVSAKLVFFNKKEQEIVNVLRRISSSLRLNKILPMEDFFDIMVLTFSSLPLIKEKIVLDYKTATDESAHLNIMQRANVMIKVAINPLCTVFEESNDYLSNGRDS
ncbi:MAG: CbiQ family ECF transporter T component [Candidatus Magnetoovum sp. WYHC-5]|nr:CbiQ family ECF transporter T component [Candidatus Magnetoovum sp. WYHC-5]